MWFKSIYSSQSELIDLRFTTVGIKFPAEKKRKDFWSFNRFVTIISQQHS